MPKQLHETLLGEKYDLAKLPDKHNKLLQKALKKFKKKPDWKDFTNYFMKICKDAFDEMPRKKITESPLYNICQDLAFRLGVEQGKTHLPDYIDKLEYLILQEYNTIAEFSKETGIGQAYFSNLFSKKKEPSLDRLKKILSYLGRDKKYQIQIVPTDNILNV